MTIPVVATASVADGAQQLAQQLASVYLGVIEPAQVSEHPFVLWVTDQGVALQQTGPKAPGAIRVDFLAGENDHRRKFGGGKGQQIAKAVGLKSGVKPGVLDVTAGLGGDAFVLAGLGCKVTLCERSPVVAALLEDGLRRAREAPFADNADGEHLIQTVARMELLQADGRDYLAAADTPEVDVVYLDPMFPARRKSAAVNKSMAAFHQVVGADTDADGLLPLALEKARHRVVVKRPRQAPPLAGVSPSYSLTGKAGRFDIYALKAFSPVATD